MAKAETTKRLIPDGMCWCACGSEVPLGKFFMPGHDRRAVQRVIVEKYGSVAGFLVEHGYGPSGEAFLSKHAARGQAK